MTDQLHHLQIGTRYTKNGISVDVHEVRNGWVYVQRWPRGVEEQELLQSLIRTPVSDFLLAIEGAEITNRCWDRL